MSVLQCLSISWAVVSIVRVTTVLFCADTVQDGVSQRCYGSSGRRRGMLAPLSYTIVLG